jgi:hypothetical protein
MVTKADSPVITEKTPKRKKNFTAFEIMVYFFLSFTSNAAKKPSVFDI